MVTLRKHLHVLQVNKIHGPNPPKLLQTRLIACGAFHKLNPQAFIPNKKLPIALFSITKQIYEKTSPIISLKHIIINKFNNDS